MIFASQWSAYRKEIVAADQQQAVPGGKTKQHSKGQSRLRSKHGPSEVTKIKGAFASSRSAREEGMCLSCTGEWWSHSWLLWFAWHAVRGARKRWQKGNSLITYLAIAAVFSLFQELRFIALHQPAQVDITLLLLPGC